MEKQDIEMKWKLEMEIGNRNGNKKMHQSLVQCFLDRLMSSVLRD